MLQAELYAALFAFVPPRQFFPKVLSDAPDPSPLSLGRWPYNRSSVRSWLWLAGLQPSTPQPSLGWLGRPLGCLYSHIGRGAVIPSLRSGWVVTDPVEANLVRLCAVGLSFCNLAQRCIGSGTGSSLPLRSVAAAEMIYGLLSVGYGVHLAPQPLSTSTLFTLLLCAQGRILSRGSWSMRQRRGRGRCRLYSCTYCHPTLRPCVFTRVTPFTCTASYVTTTLSGVRAACRLTH